MKKWCTACLAVWLLSAGHATACEALAFSYRGMADVAGQGGSASHAASRPLSGRILGASLSLRPNVFLGASTGVEDVIRAELQNPSDPQGTLAVIEQPSLRQDLSSASQEVWALQDRQGRESLFYVFYLSNAGHVQAGMTVVTAGQAGAPALKEALLRVSHRPACQSGAKGYGGAFDAQAQVYRIIALAAG